MPSHKTTAADLERWWILWPVAGIAAIAGIFLLAVKASSGLQQDLAGESEPIPATVAVTAAPEVPTSMEPSEVVVPAPAEAGPAESTELPPVAAISPEPLDPFAEPATPAAPEKRIVDLSVLSGAIGPAPETGEWIYLVTESGDEAVLVAERAPFAKGWERISGLVSAHDWMVRRETAGRQVNAAAWWGDKCWFAGNGIRWSLPIGSEVWNKSIEESGALFKLQVPRYQGSVIARNLPGDQALSAIHLDRRGRIWAASWAGGIARLEGYVAEADFSPLGIPIFSPEGWTAYTRSDGLCHDDVNGFAEDSEGRLWVGTDQGISILEDDRFTDDPFDSQFASLNVKSITNDREGRVFLGTIGGLVIIHPDRSVSVIDPSSGLPQRTPQALFVDSRDRIWVGTWGGGVVEVDRATYRLSPRNALPAAGAVGRICEDSSGTIWLASVTHGLWKLDAAGWSRVATPPGCESVRVVASLPKEIAVWQPD